MGKCPNCGHKGWMLQRFSCVNCGKQCCTECGTETLQLWRQRFLYGSPAAPDVINLYACSKECYQRFEEKVLGFPLTFGTNLNTFAEAVTMSFNSACLKALDDAFLNSKQRWMKKKVIFGNVHIGGELCGKFKERAYLAMAHNLEAVGRLEDAAKIYEELADRRRLTRLVQSRRLEDAPKSHEELKMIDKARELREKKRGVVVKRVDISVDLNELIQQVKDGGIVVVYRCPHCGGKLKISKDVDATTLKKCEHCGSEIETTELVEFLRTALS